MTCAGTGDVPTSADPRFRDVADFSSVPLFDMVVDLNPRLDFGSGPLGQRVLFASSGGTFRGPRLRGDVLPVGGDWALFRQTGVMTLDVRLALRTSDGALVQMTYGGRCVVPPELKTDFADPVRRSMVDPARYYFRTNPLFETVAEQYAWLNDIVCIGYGYLVHGGVAYRIYQVM